MYCYTPSFFQSFKHIPYFGHQYTNLFIFRFVFLHNDIRSTQLLKSKHILHSFCVFNWYMKLYLLVVTQTPGIDSDKAIIERRYSDFYKLHKSLKKMFPTFINTLEFPEKKMYGNLNDSLIRKRCQMLQKFVQETYEKKEIRISDTFKKFFYLSSLQQGCQYICGGNFEEALQFLLNGLHLQQKLALDSNEEIIATLCNTAECYKSLKNYEEVVKYCMAALELLEESASNIYLVPVLQTLVEASAILGQNTNEAERRLKEIINLNQIEVDHMATLRELAVKRFSKK